MASSKVQKFMQDAVSNHRAGRLAEADRLYRRVLALEPNNADALHLLGVVAYQSGHTRIAVDLISRAIGINPASATYHANLAQALVGAAEPDRAVAELRFAAANRPTAQDCRLISAICEQLARGADAIAFARRAATLDPDNASYHAELARLLAEQGRFEDAYTSAAMALSLDPHCQPAMEIKAQFDRRRGVL
ncbi:MAG TPA: tetratricopeptide repeat protein [Tepidisphaeraceae bacterium]|nr:tetratricopeptide repeat protein [Tepidisphaeraceae bacterium]